MASAVFAPAMECSSNHQSFVTRVTTSKLFVVSGTASRKLRRVAEVFQVGGNIPVRYQDIWFSSHLETSCINCNIYQLCTYHSTLNHEAICALSSRGAALGGEDWVANLPFGGIIHLH